MPWYSMYNADSPQRNRFRQQSRASNPTSNVFSHTIHFTSPSYSVPHFRQQSHYASYPPPPSVTTNTISVIFGRTVVLITEAVEREIRRLLAVTAVVTDRVHSRAEVTDRVGTTTAGQLIRPLSASWPVPMRSLNDSIGCWPSRPTYIGAAWITQYGRIFLTE